MNKFVITTTDDKNKANMIAKNLVSKKLAACINIISNVESIYRWDDKIHTENEFIIIIKTISRNIPRIKTYLLNNHNYEVPEIIVCDFSIIDEKYLKWFNNSIEKIK